MFKYKIRRSEALFRLLLMLAVLPVMALAAIPAGAADNAPVDDARQTAVEQIIHDYLMNNPEVIVRSLQQYQESQSRLEQEQVQARLESLGDDAGGNASTPVGGNPDGTVTVIEFFDYQCGYCKRVLPTVQELIKTDRNIRLVFREFPILGEPSLLASRASLAVWNAWPDQYMAFHDALMDSRGNITERRIKEIAGNLGVSGAQLDSAMANPAIDEEIEQTHELARSLGINGTPAFIIGQELVPGAIDLETMRQLVQQANQG